MAAAWKPVPALRRTHDELADLTTDSELAGPSQSQDVTVTCHQDKRIKVGQMPFRAGPYTVRIGRQHACLICK